MSSSKKSSPKTTTSLGAKLDELYVQINQRGAENAYISYICAQCGGLTCGQLLVCVAVASGLIVSTGFRLINLVNLFTYAYAAFGTFRALQEKTHHENEQWLMFWLLYSSFCCLENVFEFLVKWIPLYSFGKCIFLMFAANPRVKGSLGIYRVFLEPFFKRYQESFEQGIQHIEDVAAQASKISLPKKLE
jgi:hypothetical protein